MSKVNQDLEVSPGRTKYPHPRARRISAINGRVADDSFDSPRKQQALQDTIQKKALSGAVWRPRAPIRIE
jgi:hypothetical protein